MLCVIAVVLLLEAIVVVVSCCVLEDDVLVIRVLGVFAVVLLESILVEVVLELVVLEVTGDDGFVVLAPVFHIFISPSQLPLARSPFGISNNAST